MSEPNDSPSDREPRRIFTHAYVPLCPVHGVRMEKRSTQALFVWFGCTMKGCGRTKKVGRVEFVPATNRTRE